MKARIRTLSVFACVVVGLSSCIQPAEPTPSSTLVTIDPERTAVRIAQTQTSQYFEITVHFTNRSSQAIFIDAGYRAVEKLIDQKWKLAAESNPSPFTSTSFLGPGRETRFVVATATTPGQTTNPLLEDLRGLYRIRFRIAFDSRGAQPLPSDALISQPFAVTK